MQWEAVVPSRANRAHQGDCTRKASSNTSPLRGLLMKITWAKPRKPANRETRLGLSRATGPCSRCRVPMVGSSCCSLEGRSTAGSSKSLSSSKADFTDLSIGLEAGVEHL